MNANARSIIKQSAAGATTASIKKLMREHKTERKTLTPIGQRLSKQTCNILYAELIRRKE